MRHVSIIGIGQIPVAKWGSRSLRDLAAVSLRAAMQDAGLERLPCLYVSSMLSGELAGQENLGALVADAAGLTGIEAMRVEAACGGGGAALHLGVLAIASGVHDVVAVTGVEKMTGRPLADVLAGLATAADAEDEAALGLTFAGINALMMRRYMYEYSWRSEDFAAFSINAHRNAQANENAMFRQAITEQQYQASRLVADPVRLLDASPISDGAATVILCAGETAGRFARRPVRISGSTLATDTVALHSRADILCLEGAQASAHAAYVQAGRSAKDIDLFELHDAFSIMAALSLEAAGFAARGEGLRLACDGQIGLQGKIPICTMGGLKARGHPVGASGVYQAVECALQLRGTAGPNQIGGARVAMAQSIGGSGASVATHIFEV